VTAPLLIELGCEELPANACRVADETAGPLLERLLADRRLAPASVRTLVSPRRIAVLAAAVPERQGGERIEHRGPPERVARDADGWTRAGAGFARKHGLGTDALTLRDGFAWVAVEAETASLDAVIGGVVDGLVDGLQMPKNMRWGAEQLRFARPIRTLLVLHGSRLLDATVAGVRSGRTVRGHRLVAPAVEIPSADAYEDALREAGVVVPTEARREQIVAALDAGAARLGIRWSDPGGVLREVVHLVERPHVISGSFDRAHLELPDRVAVTAMQAHQRYLPLDRDGARFPGFLAVVNSDPAHDERVRGGNERVLAGRLEDAGFSYRQDLERGLAAMAASLDRVTFHARAGTLADKTVRISVLVDRLADAARVDHAVRMPAMRAASLAKADQASIMVAEFAELEGYIGEQYARAAGLPAAVAAAIGEQYLPDRADAAPPATEPGALLALADKLDTLVAMFAVGEQPTGSRDPYALRRAAAGVVAIALDRGWRFDVAELVGVVDEILASQGAERRLAGQALAEAVTAFLFDRVDALLTEREAAPHDLLRVVRGGRPAGPVDYAARVRLLLGTVEGEEFARVYTAYTRSHRLAARGESDAAPAVDEAHFLDESERALATTVAEVATPLRAAVADGRYAEALTLASRLGPPVDAFFDAVLVMHEDPHVRGNRLRLLADVTALAGALGDFAELQR
jgi:glycyl-tRNA synthetase beta chain